jgi:hypothetical protein
MIFYIEIEIVKYGHKVHDAHHKFTLIEILDIYYMTVTS